MFLQPYLLYRKDTEIVIHSDNDFATVAFLRIKDATLEPKDGNANADVEIPSLLDEHFEVVRRSLVQLERDPSRSDSHTPTERLELKVSSVRKGKWIAVANVQANVTVDMSIEEEVTQCFKILNGTVTGRTQRSI